MRSKIFIPYCPVKPLPRLQKPTECDALNHLPYAPLGKSKFPIFSADFESGNLGQVFMTGARKYEIRLIPDPTWYYSAFWYFFKAEQLTPGEYSFTIVGFSRDAMLHQIGVQPTALSINGTRIGIGWQRFGENMNFWCSKSGKIPQYSLSFTFNVLETDTMYFAYIYPYTYTDLRCWLNKQDIVYSSLCESHGGVDIPAIFWDSDMQKFGIPRFLSRFTDRTFNKPLIVIAARHHPGETVASFAMEGFMSALFDHSLDSISLLKNFSFLLLPMINVDGVICGYYRPSLTGYDMNRSWIAPNQEKNPVESSILALLDQLVKTRRILFLLDFHGHSAQCNAFTYGVMNERVALNEYQGLFPRLMARTTSFFDVNGGCTMAPDSYGATMRVALHHRYDIPFSYTLEMSFGGVDIGPKKYTQMTQNSYRQIGEATVRAMSVMLLEQVPLDSFRVSKVKNS